MAAPAAAIVARKLVTQFLADPKGVLKVIGIILGIIAIILLLIAIPVILLISVPVILFKAVAGVIGGVVGFLFGSHGKNHDPNADNFSASMVAIYQKAPETFYQRSLQWIDDQKKENASSDDFVVNMSYNLDWKALITIDAVRYNQDFTKVTEKDVFKMAEGFVHYDTKTEKYQAPEQYQEEETYTETEYVYDKKTDQFVAHDVKKTRTVTKVRMVEKKRTILTVTTSSFDQMMESMDFGKDDRKIAENMYAFISSANFEDSLNIYDDVDPDLLKEYPPGNANIPYFNQTDKRWGTKSYGTSGTIYSGGCGPTALAMVVAGLTGRMDVTPDVVANWSVTTGHRCEGAGSYWSLITDGGAYYGLKVEAVSRYSPEKIIAALSQGKPVIACMGPGHFTKGGHFIVLRGLDKDGKVLVNDPVSVKRSDEAWDISIIMTESSTNAGDGGSPFWILSN